MKRYRITDDSGLTYLTWAYSARNAIFAHKMAYRGPHYNITAIEVAP